MTRRVSGPKVHIPVVIAAVVLAVTCLTAGFTVFVVNRVVDMQAQATVTLPVHKDQVEAPKEVVFVDEENRIFYQQEEVSSDELKARLQAKPPGKLLIKAHQRAKYQTMRSLLTELGQIGLTDVTFTVVQDEGF